MLEVKKLVNPSPKQWDIAIEGMRHAFKSYDRADSSISSDDTGFILGEKDKGLLMNLTKLGTSDRKVLRQLPILMTITAPEYWWRQFDTYKVGTAANSTSQMHTLLKDGFKKSDFSIEQLDNSIAGQTCINNALDQINELREFYLDRDLDEAKEFVWEQILELIPQSINYTRTVSLNYEVAVTMINQRQHHKLLEWHQLIDYLLENVPYLKEIVEASRFKDNLIKDLKEKVEELENEVEKLNKSIENTNPDEIDKNFLSKAKSQPIIDWEIVYVQHEEIRTAYYRAIKLIDAITSFYDDTCGEAYPVCIRIPTDEG